MAYDRNNVFAKILRGEIPSHKVYEDAQTLAFMDVMPQADGHTLVIPKVEAESLLDVPPEALAATIVTTQRVARAVKAAFARSGNPGRAVERQRGGSDRCFTSISTSCRGVRGSISSSTRGRWRTPRCSRRTRSGSAPHWAERACPSSASGCTC